MKFSIILPVKNGGGYVKECVNSILAQTYSGFNLLILENCSTDGTAEWLHTLKDERVTIYPAERPLSIEENWGRIVSIPRNEYMTMIGHDDVLDHNYLEVMYGLIEKYPDASLYQTHFRYIDAKGRLIKKCKPMVERQSAGEFLEGLLQNRININGTGFMLRSKDYNATGGIGGYPNLLFADFELWISAAKKGYLATAGEECFSFRLHQSMTTISADIKLQKAFGQFVEYLETLKQENTSFAKIISTSSIEFIQFWCKGLTHRLLRTPTNKRNGLSVSLFLYRCKNYADRLSPNNHFNPLDKFSVKLARDIDRLAITRSLFLAFKKIYSKPVLS